MKFPTYEVVFFFFGFMLILNSILVVVSRNPVKSILCLILAFFCSSVLWMMTGAEFLSLVLIFVYVGAVMTLFLFVVMMIDFRGIFVHEGRRKYASFALLIFLMLLGIVCLALISSHLPIMHSTLPVIGEHANNTRSLGVLLFTDYIYPFEIAGAILLVAIIAAISLSFHGKRSGTKQQNINQQEAATKADRLKIIKMKGEVL